MKLSLSVVYLALVFSLLSLNEGISQAQFNLKAGVEAWSIKDEIDLSGESHHSGQTIGFDMHILDSRFLFAPGFHYHRISALNKEEGLQFRFGDKNHIHYFSIPMTFGYKVFDLAVVDISGLAGGEVFFFYSLESNDIGLDDDQLHGVYTALTGVVHTSVFSFLTAEIKYRHAFHPIFKERPESKLRGWSLEVGVKF